MLSASIYYSSVINFVLIWNNQSFIDFYYPNYISLSIFNITL